MKASSRASRPPRPRRVRSSSLGQPTPDRSIAPYFVEDIRKVLEQKFGADALYQTGLRVQTTLDVELQEAANAAHRSRPPPRRQAAQRIPAAGAQHRRRGPHDRGVHDRAMVAADSRRRHRPGRRDGRARSAGGSARVRIGEYDVELPPSAFAWTRRTSAADLFKVGDLIEVKSARSKGRRPTN